MPGNRSTLDAYSMTVFDKMAAGGLTALHRTPFTIIMAHFATGLRTLGTGHATSRDRWRHWAVKAGC